MTRRLYPLLMLLFLARTVTAQGVDVRPDGETMMPAIRFPNSGLMSDEGHRSRAEHILTERSLKGKSVDELNAALFGPRLQRMLATFPVTQRDETLGGVRVRIYEPAGGIKAGDRGKVLINVHGGGFVGCFIECGGLESVPMAVLTGLRVVSIDYRMAPIARFPAASQDVESVYRALLRTASPKQIGLFGCSAGGLLTAQSLAWFQTRGLPAPAAAGIFCAGADPGMGGDSRIIGTVLGDGEMPRAPAPAGSPPMGYMAGATPTDPTAYPITSASTLAAFPPTLVIVGTRDFAFSSAVHLHSRLVANGVDARLHAWEGGRHAFFYDSRVPEAREAFDVMARFFRDRLSD